MSICFGKYMTDFSWWGYYHDDTGYHEFGLGKFYIILERKGK